MQFHFVVNQKLNLNATSSAQLKIAFRKGQRIHLNHLIQSFANLFVAGPEFFFSGLQHFKKKPLKGIKDIF